jgi:hypothetical protein
VWVEAKLHTSLSSTLGRDEWSLSRPGLCVLRKRIHGIHGMDAVSASYACFKAF